MLKVVKATERDGVTPKDGDIGELLAETGVEKRNGLVMVYPTSVELLPNTPYMILADEDEDYAIRTSQIIDININDEGQTVVTTRNTIYFLEEIPDVVLFGGY